MQNRPLLLLLVSATSFLLADVSGAQIPPAVGPFSPAGRWTGNGRILVTAEGDRLDLRAVRDGFGGAYLVWRDTRDRAEGEIYVTRVGANGATVTPWPESGLRVRAGVNGTPRGWLAQGDRGGAYVVVSDAALSTEVIVHHFRPDATSAPGWPAQGLTVPLFGPLKQLAALQEGYGGLTLEGVEVVPDDEVFVRRRWAFSGQQFSISGGPDGTNSPAIIDLVGAIGRQGYTFHALHIEPIGWAYPSSHVSVYQGTAVDYALSAYVCDDPPRVFGDDLQGAWAFQRGLTGTSGPRGWRLDADRAFDLGPVTILPEEVVGASADGKGGVLYMTLDATGQSYIARRLNPTGPSAAWWTEGLVLFASANTVPQFMQPDLGGGALLGSMTTSDGQSTLTGRRLRDDGSFDPAWTAAGSPIRTGPGTAGSVTAMLDGAGGYLVFWLDRRAGKSEIFGQSFGPTDIVGIGSPAGTMRLSLTLARQPARSGDRIRCVLGNGGNARLELFDVRGRRMWSESIPPGSGEVVDLALPGGLARGVAWLRLTQGGDESTARVVVVP